jgi:hypothetical protein
MYLYNMNTVLISYTLIIFKSKTKTDHYLYLSNFTTFSFGDSIH